MQNYEEGEIPLISENEAAKGAETPVNQPKTFSHAYFKEAAKVFKDARKLAFAAVICALRVAVKSLSLQIAPGVYLSFDCYVNALGSLVYGPLMALCVGAVSDTIGGVMFPRRVFFPVYPRGNEQRFYFRSVSLEETAYRAEASRREIHR